MRQRVGSVPFLSVAAFVSLVASVAAADATIRWAARYPKPGAMRGEIIVKGRAKADRGYTLTSAKVKYWPAFTGGVMLAAEVTLKANGRFEETIDGLTPGVTYHVLVEVVEESDTDRQVLSTDPATISVP